MSIKIFRSVEDLPLELRGGAVAIGNFDGVHRGHQAVINNAGVLARNDNIPFGVVTFEPHPRSVFQKELAPFRLTPLKSKAKEIENLKADFLLAIQFNRNFASISAEDFIKKILFEGLGARHIVVGYDFLFGRGRIGNRELLLSSSTAFGYQLTVVEGVAHGDPAEGAETYGSSRIREFLVAGSPALAADWLGRWWEIEGLVASGDQRGRTLGFPTVNIALNEHLAPALGVYAVRLSLKNNFQEKWHEGVANIGCRPTFEGGRMLLEVHIFDFDKNVYDSEVRVALLEFLRPEKKFEGLEALKAQILLDCAKAKKVLQDPKYSQARFEKLNEF